MSALLHFSVPFDCAQGRVGNEKSGQIDDLEGRLDPAVLVPPSMFNASKHCAYCVERLATSTGEVIVCFIALLSPFDRAQGRVGSEKSGRLA